MSIMVVCPNGHKLKVKDKYAGKSGRCPMCKSRIRVPVPFEEVPGGLVRGILDPDKSGLSGLALAVPEFIDEPTDFETGGEAATKICGKCLEEIPTSAEVCPHCKAYIADLGDS